MWQHVSRQGKMAEVIGAHLNFKPIARYMIGSLTSWASTIRNKLNSIA